MTIPKKEFLFPSKCIIVEPGGVQAGPAQGISPTWNLGCSHGEADPSQV